MKPLGHSSQIASSDVLYFDTAADISDLFECMSARLDAAFRLNDELAKLICSGGGNQIDQVAISGVTSLLLSDVVSMMTHVHDQIAKEK